MSCGDCPSYGYAFDTDIENLRQQLIELKQSIAGNNLKARRISREISESATVLGAGYEHKLMEVRLDGLDYSGAMQEFNNLVRKLNLSL